MQVTGFTLAWFRAEPSWTSRYVGDAWSVGSSIRPRTPGPGTGTAGAGPCALWIPGSDKGEQFRWAQDPFCVYCPGGITATGAVLDGCTSSLQQRARPAPFRVAHCGLPAAGKFVLCMDQFKEW